MSENETGAETPDGQSTGQDGNESGQTSAAEKPEFEPIKSQEEFDRAVAARVNRERSKFADYADLKEKASKFDEIEEQNKTDLEKLQSRAEQAERERDEERFSALRYRYAAQCGANDEDAELFLTGPTEEKLKEQAERYKAMSARKPGDGLRIDHSGRDNVGASNSDAAKDFFGI